MPKTPDRLVTPEEISDLVEEVIVEQEGSDIEWVPQAKADWEGFCSSYTSDYKKNPHPYQHGIKSSQQLGNAFDRFEQADCRGTIQRLKPYQHIICFRVTLTLFHSEKLEHLITFAQSHGESETWSLGEYHKAHPREYRRLARIFSTLSEKFEEDYSFEQIVEWIVPQEVLERHPYESREFKRPNQPSRRPS